MGSLASFLEKRNDLFWGSIGFLFIILLGIIDYLTGYELSFSLFYLAPISLIAWFRGRRFGVLASAVSAIAWFLADFLSGSRYSNPSMYVWNTLIRLGFFLVVTRLLSALRNAYDTNQELARVDYVTGAVSVRFFYDLAKIEIGRSARYNRPLTFVYIDMDNFKSINDLFGHSTGDRVLRAVTEIIQRQVRPSDSLGRLGGDEFALLLPETSEEEARKVISRLHGNLVSEMLKNGWMITFSVGVVTFNHPPKSVDEMVKLADIAMYSIKTKGKNGVSYRVYAD
jgi:diguanylate cyclase (GGDEF)-like protein